MAVAGARPSGVFDPRPDFRDLNDENPLSDAHARVGNFAIDHTVKTQLEKLQLTADRLQNIAKKLETAIKARPGSAQAREKNERLKKELTDDWYRECRRIYRQDIPGFERFIDNRAYLVNQAIRKVPLHELHYRDRDYIDEKLYPRKDEAHEKFEKDLDAQSARIFRYAIKISAMLGKPLLIAENVPPPKTPARSINCNTVLADALTASQAKIFEYVTTHPLAVIGASTAAVSAAISIYHSDLITGLAPAAALASESIHIPLQALQGAGSTLGSGFQNFIKAYFNAKTGAILSGLSTAIYAADPARKIINHLFATRAKAAALNAAGGTPKEAALTAAYAAERAVAAAAPEALPAAVNAALAAAAAARQEAGRIPELPAVASAAIQAEVFAAAAAARAAAEQVLLTNSNEETKRLSRTLLIGGANTAIPYLLQPGFIAKNVSLVNKASTGVMAAGFGALTVSQSFNPHRPKLSIFFGEVSKVLFTTAFLAEDILAGNQGFITEHPALSLFAAGAQLGFLALLSQSKRMGFAAASALAGAAYQAVGKGAAIGTAGLGAGLLAGLYLKSMKNPDGSLRHPSIIPKIFGAGIGIGGLGYGIYEHFGKQALQSAASAAVSQVASHPYITAAAAAGAAALTVGAATGRITRETVREWGEAAVNGFTSKTALAGFAAMAVAGGTTIGNSKWMIGAGTLLFGVSATAKVAGKIFGGLFR